MKALCRETGMGIWCVEWWEVSEVYWWCIWRVSVEGQCFDKWSFGFKSGIGLRGEEKEDMGIEFDMSKRRGKRVENNGWKK